MGNSGSAVDGADSGIGPGWDFWFLEKSMANPHAAIVMAPFARATYGDFSETSNSNRDVVTTRGDLFCGMSNGQSCVCVLGAPVPSRAPTAAETAFRVVMTDTRSVCRWPPDGKRREREGFRQPFTSSGQGTGWDAEAERGR